MGINPFKRLSEPAPWHYGVIKVIPFRGKMIRYVKKGGAHKEVTLSSVNLSASQEAVVYTVAEGNRAVKDVVIKPSPDGRRTHIVLIYEASISPERAASASDEVRQGLCKRFDAPTPASRRSNAPNSPYDNARTRSDRKEAQEETRPSERGSYTTKAGTTYAW